MPSHPHRDRLLNGQPTLEPRFGFVTPEFWMWSDPNWCSTGSNTFKVNIISPFLYTQASLISLSPKTGLTMSEQAGDGSLTIRDDVPFPIRPRKKAAILIAIILLSIIQIIFGAISLPFVDRHSGYGRRGAWTRPWNQVGVPSTAVFNVCSSPS